MVGLVVLFFVVSLPMAFRLESSSDGVGKLDGEGNDDPIVDLLCLKGLEEMSDGNYNRAIAHYNKAIDRDPKYAFAYIGRGDAHRANGDLDRAISDYDKAARVDPGNPTARERAEDARKERASR
jgi:tetratricopeptide (TPR) repeat protein